MKITKLFQSFVGSCITSVIDCGAVQNKAAELIAAKFDHSDMNAEIKEKVLGDMQSAEDIGDEVKSEIKDDIDADDIKSDISEEVKGDIDADEIKSEIQQEVRDEIDTADIIRDVKQEIIDGIDDDFTALVVEEISGKISPDDVSAEVVTELCERGNFVETVKREVIATLARVFADSYSEDFKSAVRTLAQGAQTVLKASEEILYTNPKDALDEAIEQMEVEQASRLDRFKQVMSINDRTEEEDRAVELKRAADALKIAAYNDALDAANRTSMAYSHEIARVSKQQEVARMAEDAMSNAYGVLKAAEVGAKEAGVDIRLQCKVL